MANKCLVTKLNGMVNNDNLPILGALTVKVKSVTSPTDNQRKLTITVAETETVKVKAVGGSFTKNGVSMTELTLNNSDGVVVLYFSNGDYKVNIENKYGILTLQTAENSIISFNLDEFVLPKTLSIVAMSSGNTGSIDNIKLEDSANVISLKDNTNISGNISSLSGYTSLIYLNLRNCAGISGDIESLGGMPSLTTIDIYGTSIGGTIEGFVAAQVAAGRTSVAPFSANGISRCSFGGSTHVDASRANIGWDSASKITIYTGSPIVSECTTIYAKGATAEEIAAWEQAGKTVTVVS